MLVLKLKSSSLTSNQSRAASKLWRQLQPKFRNSGPNKETFSRKHVKVLSEVLIDNLSEILPPIKFDPKVVKNVLLK